MKQFAFFLLLLLHSSLVFAQKGSNYLGGGLGYNNRISDDGNTEHLVNSFSFGPEVGTWLSNHFQAGVGINMGRYYSATRVSGNLLTESKSFTYGGRLYGRYWLSPGKTLRPFVGGVASLDFGRMENFQSSPTNSNSLGLNLQLGIGYAISPKLTLVGAIGAASVRSTVSKFEDKSTRFTEVNFDLGLSGTPFNLGMFWTI